MERGIHRKATYEDRFYRNWTTAKQNHNSGWAKDKKRGRKDFRIFLKQELEKLEEELGEEDDEV